MSKKKIKTRNTTNVLDVGINKQYIPTKQGIKTFSEADGSTSTDTKNKLSGSDIANGAVASLGTAMQFTGNLINTANNTRGATQAYDLANSIGNQKFMSSSFNDFMNSYNNRSIAKTDYTKRDFGTSTGQKFIQGLQNTIQGAGAGASAGGLGTLVGAVTGLGMGIAQGLIGNKNEIQAANQANALGNLNNFMSRNSANLAFNDLQNTMMENKLINSNAEGGPLEFKTDFPTGLTFINEGGTHESNPNEGVQVGIDNEGVPNLVEEGEIIFNDYVFSNRLTPNKNLLKEGGLNKKYKDWTFASIAEDLSKESLERPNDNISKRGLNDSMMRLAFIQENVRNSKKSKESNKFEEGGPKPINVNSLLNFYNNLKNNNWQDLDEETLDMLRNNDLLNLYTPQEGHKKYTSWKDLGNKLLNVIQTPESFLPKDISMEQLAEEDALAGNPNRKVYPSYKNYSERTLGNQLLNAIDLPQEDYMHSLQEEDASKYYYPNSIPEGFTPWNNFDEETLNNLYQDDLRNQVNKDVKSLDLPFKLPDIKIDDIPDNDSLDEMVPLSKMIERGFKPFKRIDNGLSKVADSEGMKRLNSKIERNEKIQNEVDSKVNREKGIKPKNNFDYSTLLRYSPVLTNGAALISNALQKPDYSRADASIDAANRIPFADYVENNNYMGFTPVDRSFYMNQLSNQLGADRNAIINQSSNAGQAMSGLIAAQNNAGNAFNNLALNIDNTNYQRLANTNQYNSGIKQTNNQNRLQSYQLNQARQNNILDATYRANAMKDAIDNQKNLAIASNIQGLSDSLAGIGTEAFNMNMANNAGYNTVINPDGTLSYIKKAYGGMLTKRRRKHGK